MVSKTVQKQSPVPSSVSIFEYFAGWFVVLLVFLMPLKFGSLAVMPEAAGYYPPDHFSWLFISFPPHAAGIFSGAALLLVLAACHRIRFGKNLLTVLLLWGFALPLAALCGLISCRSMFYGSGEVIHFAGCAALAAAVGVLLLSEHGRDWHRRLSFALAAAVLIAGVIGLKQYFTGFDEMRAFMRQQMEMGVYISGTMQSKIKDTRVFGCMVSANILAGFLLLCTAFCAAYFYRLGRLFEPEKVSRGLFLAIAVVCSVPVLFMTRSRAAFLCALLCGGCYLLSLNYKRIWKILLVLVAAAVVAAGAFYIRQTARGFDSFGERLDYLRTASVMVRENPVSGAGWGAFFYRHMALKSAVTDEASHDPHNVFASFWVHAGLPGFLLISAVLLVPLFLLWKQRKKLSGCGKAILWGCIAFVLHLCVDVNMQIPGTFGLLGVMMLLGVFELDENDGNAPEAEPEKLSLRLGIPMYVLLAAAAGVSLYGNWQWVRGDAAYAAFQEAVYAGSNNKPFPGITRVNQLFREVEDLRKGHPFACLDMGDLHQGLGNYDLAKHYYLLALERDPRRPGTLKRLSDLERSAGNEAAAQAYLRKAYKMFPTYPKYAGGKN